MITRLRAPLLPMAIASVLSALWAGLLRLGWPWPSPRPDFAMLHGPLMVAGFLGTMIGLERAVALAAASPGDRRTPWLFVGPWLSGLGALALLAGAPIRFGAGLMALAALALVTLSILRYRRAPSILDGALIAGALAWLFGTMHWLAGQSIYDVVWLWLAFLVLTVSAEQLALSLTLPSSSASSPPPSAWWPWSPAARRVYLFALTLVLVGAAAPAHGWPPGLRLAGVGALALAAWLVRFDPARQNLVVRGWPGFSAKAAMLAYSWLAIGGLLMLALGPATAGLAYDAMLHSVFVGLVFTMFFAHVPVVLPELLGRTFAYQPLAWLPLGLLQASLVLRLAGDLGANVAARQWGGLLNEVALLLLLGGLIATVLRAPKPGA